MARFLHFLITAEETLYATPLSVVYSRNLRASWSNRFEINTIWQSSQPKKRHKPLRKKKRKRLVVSPEGTLIPSILLPAHFMPGSALIDVKIILHLQEYQCVSLCVCLFSPHTCLCVCVCVCVLCLCFFYFKFHYNALFVRHLLNLLSEPHLSAGAGGTHHRDERSRRLLFFLMYTAHLNCMSLLLCCDLCTEG